MDYTPTDERRAYLHRYAAGRPLTLGLFSAGWQELKRRKASYERGELLNSFQQPQDSPPPSERELNAMSDSEVDRLYHASLKEYADSFRRRGPGLAGEIASALWEKGVRIQAFSAELQEGQGIFHLAVDNAALARQTFIENGWKATEEGGFPS